MLFKLTKNTITQTVFDTSSFRIQNLRRTAKVYVTFSILNPAKDSKKFTTLFGPLLRSAGELEASTVK